MTPLLALLGARRSTRSFTGSALHVDGLSHVLRAGLGRRPDGGSVVPSAHGLDRLGIRVIAGGVGGLSPGTYTYSPTDDVLLSDIEGDHRAEVASATLVDEEWAQKASALLVVTVELSVLQIHFHDQPPVGQRGDRYAWMEAGHISQSIYLAAAELNLRTVLIAGFDDDRLSATVASLFPSMPAGSTPVALMALDGR